MDHIQRPLWPQRGSSVIKSSNVHSALFTPSSHEIASAVFAPLHYERGYAYPLLVWLHGEKTDEGQLMRIMPEISIRNYVAVAPHGVRPDRKGEPDLNGYGWQQSREQILEAEQQIFDSIEFACQKYHIARRRVFLAGFDSGGTMAFRVAMNHPTLFAGVLSLCGPFPHGCEPFGNLVQARQLPVFLAVGRDSTEYPPEKVCEDLRLFHAAGLSVTLRQYPCGHQISRQMLRDMDSWMMDQIAPDKAIAEQANHLWSREAE